MVAIKNISAIRGAILEEVVLYLLQMIGYRIVEAKQDGTKRGSSGLEVQGRGAWHQIDAYAAHDHTPAFIYPIRLLMEAKCYKKKIGIEIIRNAVGVLKDISENYFTFSPTDPEKAPRFNFVSAVFSTSEFTKPAQQYALAHQIFLIQYDHVYLFEDIKMGIMSIEDKHFMDKDVSIIRKEVRDLLNQEKIIFSVGGNSCFTLNGIALFKKKIHGSLKKIKGSYFGMLQGKWPLHLLSNKPLPPALFRNSDTIQCKIHGNAGARKWKFVPSNVKSSDDRNYFELEFDLPEEIYSMVQKQKDHASIAEIKGTNFSFIHLSGNIGGIKRQITLKLDVNWLEKYKVRYTKGRNSST